MELVIVSGRSGAGKSSVLNALEENGYYCVDNIPIRLLTALVDELKENEAKVAISLDIRNLNTSSGHHAEQQYIDSILEKFRSELDLRIIYLDCSSEVILRRYSNANTRAHPLSSKYRISLEEAIAKEVESLSYIRNEADLIIDTSTFNIYDLVNTINGLFRPNGLILVFYSFGFKRRMPPSSNFVFDVRHLPNPFWHEELAKLTGTDKEVDVFFRQSETALAELERISDYLTGWLAALGDNSSRKFVTVSIGCTGGQHRSVWISDQLARKFSAQGFHAKSYHFTSGIFSDYN